jgi:XTP/dITP diphosphohydrolase
VRGPVLVATRSAGKLREILPMFAAAGITAIGLDAAGIPESQAEDGLEAYATFEENARAKALHFHGVSGMLTVADDSGLEVDALGGAPGVYSKRWSGVHAADAASLDAANNAYLLQRLAGVAERTARFVCVAAAAGAGGMLATRGEVTGTVSTALRGDGGFGYDACFIPHEGDGRTFAELPAAVKASLSHRARAFEALVRALRSA